MTKIVSIVNGDSVVPSGEVDERLVKLLEELVDKAKNGRLSGLAYVEIESGGVFRTNWWVQPTWEASNAMAAGLAAMQHRVGIELTRKD